jgi:hypothetical protein
MSGWSQRFKVDRIVLRSNGMPDASWQNAPDPLEHRSSLFRKSRRT